MGRVLTPVSPQSHRWISSVRADDMEITQAVTEPIFRKPGRVWWLALMVSLVFVVWTIVAVVWLFWQGIGVWGVNTTVVWGFAIANYVWWIGIGNAGTLISSMLLLTNQKWRASINRFTEAMTLFAVAIAGTMPIVHLGRPFFFYWLAPYPNTMSLWPQWRSALVWDFWAILSYLLFSVLFWYHGLIPDLATMRDRAKNRRQQIFYGLLAMGWRGSIQHWKVYNLLHYSMAALAVPLVCSVHSIVGLDFAASLMPGWNVGLFPPYFVVGAMYSGFAMVVVLCIALRWGFGLQALITRAHFEVMGRVMLMASIVMGLSYATLYFMAWYGGQHSERNLVVFYFTGSYALLYWCLLICNVGIPQLLWFPAIRGSILAIFIISIIINIGMWLERILIVWTTLSHGYAISLWHIFEVTFWDWSLLFAPFGLFALLFLLLVRVFPAVSMVDTREVAHEEGAA